jgi:hypothetical protein
VKKRWGLIAASALVCLIGWSWLASKWGMSSLDLGGIRMVGMLVACVVAFGAMRKDVHAKWPAVVALVGTVPMLFLALQLLGDFEMVFQLFGAPIVIVFAGGLTTSAAALIVTVMPLPLPPAPPPVAPARVVDS